MNKVLLSSKNMDWCTPQWLFDELNREFKFELDAAATHKSAKCGCYFTKEYDGLLLDWAYFYKSIFLNPPYGREIGKWVKKAYEESEKGAKVVMLLPSRTDTSYFHDYILGKAEIRFLRGRLKFTDEDGKEYAPAPFPSMVVVYDRA